MNIGEYLLSLSIEENSSCGNSVTSVIARREGRLKIGMLVFSGIWIYAELAHEK
jgi:hypothetical protein